MNIPLHHTQVLKDESSDRAPRCIDLRVLVPPVIPEKAQKSTP